MITRWTNNANYVVEMKLAGGDWWIRLRPGQSLDVEAPRGAHVKLQIRRAARQKLQSK